MRLTIFALGLGVAFRISSGADHDFLRDCNNHHAITRSELKENGWFGFRGQVSAVDLAGNALGVDVDGKRYAVYLTPETVICYRGERATLREARVGEWIGGITKLVNGRSVALHLGLGSAAENHPYGLLVPHKPDYLVSPFAPEKPPFYVGRMSYGAIVKCPYTGKFMVRPPPQ